MNLSCYNKLENLLRIINNSSIDKGFYLTNELLRNKAISSTKLLYF